MKTINITDAKEKEAFVLDILKQQSEKKDTASPSVCSKDMLLGFHVSPDKTAKYLTLKHVLQDLMESKIHAIGALYLDGILDNVRPDPVEHGSELQWLSFYLDELAGLMKTEHEFANRYCKSFVALLCNIINPVPSSMEEARELVDILHIALFDYVFTRGMEEKPVCERGDGVRIGKQILSYIATGGEVPKLDIIVMVTDNETKKQISDCNALITHLLADSTDNGLKLMGGMMRYDDLKKHDHICLSDFVMAICHLPEDEDKERTIQQWKILCHFTTTLIYGFEGAKSEDNVIDIFNRIMRVKETMARQKLN